MINLPQLLQPPITDPYDVVVWEGISEVTRCPIPINQLTNLMAETLEFILDIRSLDGVGPLRFGMTKEQVSRCYTQVYSSFFKTPNSVYRSDQNEYVGWIAHYDEHARVNYIEILPRPTYSKTRVTFEGQDITDFTMDRANKLFSMHCPSDQDEYGYYFHELGISLYCNDWEGADDLIDCIGIVPTKNYWKTLVNQI